MIRLLKWIFALSLIATFLVAIIGNLPDKPYLLIAIFFAFCIIGWLISFIINKKAFFQVIWLAELIIYFTYELFKASIIVAHEVITPKHHMQAGIVAVPLDTQTNIELTIFSSLVSLTPGTLTIDVSADKTVLYVHAMYISNADSKALANELKTGFEQRVIKIFRNEKIL